MLILFQNVISKKYTLKTNVGSVVVYSLFVVAPTVCVSFALVFVSFLALQSSP